MKGNKKAAAKTKKAAEEARGPQPSKTKKKAAAGKERKAAEGENDVDLREQLVNGGAVGPITEVSLPEPMITSLRGILLDFDPSLYRKAVADPKLFCGDLVERWLSRHPVFQKAEVRSSGRGLHVLLLFDRPVEFATQGERQLWAAVVKVIQRLLPTDPGCPGITALTRPVGSVNSKNGKQVRLLKEGRPVDPQEVLALFEEVKAAPFRTVASLLFGGERVSPCPLCQAEGSALVALDHSGKCYGCGQVRIGQLFDVFLKPRAKKGG